MTLKYGKLKVYSASAKKWYVSYITFVAMICMNWPARP